MFKTETGDFVTAWHGYDYEVVSVPVCFTNDEWKKFYIAAYYSKTISNSRKSLSESEAARLACKEDCSVGWQVDQLAKGLCKPINFNDTPLSTVIPKRPRRVKTVVAP